MPENDIKKKAEQLSAEVAAAKQQAATAEQKAASLENEVKEQKTVIEGQKTSIDNLDASVKEQSATIAELKKQLSEKPVDFKTAFRNALNDKKSDIDAKVAAKAEKFSITVEVKSVTSITTGSISPNGFLGLQVDPAIHAAVPGANVFIAAFGMRPRTGNKLAWVEATTQSGADYVAEMSQNTAKSDVAFAEKTRAFGKICTYMQISTEVEDWFEQLYNYCVNEGVRLVDAKIDSEICNGAGSDATYPNKVYGIKGAATAFSALAAHAVAKANIADVIFDAADQIAKAGYHANAAFLTWALYRQLKSLKDDNGNYLFDKVNSMLDGIKVYPTDVLSTGELIVADTSCAEPYAGNSYELEFIRNGAYDGYDVYFRKAVQVKTPTPKKKGLIYVASATTAIAALQVSN